MPIYEFYCADCHTIFNFFARTYNTTSRPKCPRCQRVKLERQVSRFAISSGATEEPTEDAMPDMDDAQMERLMEEFAREGDSMDEEDPKQMARMMRRICESTGMELGPGMQEAMRRMEAGEDPDKVEEEMGDVLEEEEPFFGGKKGRLKQFSRQLLPPNVDEGIYDLD